ncbi:MAG TPA: hypothetical protein VK478_16175 [Gemmatimonadaceae bacterium]|nr:hypothetical protein [Gemmatimonadaceae bacterium]
MKSRWIVLCLLVSGAPGCTVDIGAPKNLRGVHVVSDINRADTIDARSSNPILLRISDSTGRLDDTVTVVIAGIPNGSIEGSLGMFPLDDAGNSPSYLVFRTVEQASFRVKFGRRAGQGAIVVSVEELGLVDTLWFTVKPGAPVRIAPAPSDAAVTVGGTYQQSAKVLDRAGNERDPTSPFTFSGLDPAATVSAGGKVTGVAYGRTRIKVSYEALAETAMVSVVPTGRLATVFGPLGLSDPSVVGTLTTDGSEPRRYATPYFVTAAVWSADATRIYYVGRPRSFLTPRIYSLTLADGTSSPLVPDTVSALSGALLASPAVSLDGAWIYFTTLLSAYGAPSGDIWRVHPDGTGLARVVGAGTAGSPYRRSPSPSPDGTKLAYAEEVTTNKNVIKILDLQSGTTLTITGPGADEIRWSPTGDRIAVKGGGILYVVNVDGSQQTQLAPFSSYSPGVDWSPDGRWIVANLSGVLTILEPTTTGLRLPLDFYCDGQSWSPR